MKTIPTTAQLLITIAFVSSICSPVLYADEGQAVRFLEYSQLVDLPDALGVAGPFVGCSQ